MVGVVALPATGEVLSAANDRGAFLNGVPFEAHEPPGALRDIGVAIEGFNQGFDDVLRRLQRAVGRSYSFESAAYPIGQVLLGRLHGIGGLRRLSVHTAAGVVIARELGIRVTDESGNDVIWDPGAPRNGLVLAWPRTHEALLEALSHSGT